jgi:low temperature requirement protein LtrA
LTIIVLGETLLASGHAIKALNEHFSPLLMCTVIGGLLITFSMWWFYFDEHEHKRLQYSNRGYMWSYGHILVFISISTVGAGLEVMNDKIGGHAEVSLHVANAMVAVPTAIFMVSMWLLHDLFSKRSFEAKLLYPAAAMLVLTTPFFEYGTFAVGLLLLLTLAIRLKMDTASSPTEYVTNL